MRSFAIRFTILSGALILAGSMLLTITPGKASTEAGSAKFLRSHTEAIALAKKQNKPIFAFFQEVPG